MHKEELKNPRFLEIKFYRLTSPLFNYSNIPLSGLYNPLDNIESKEFILNNKFKNFDLSSTDFINTENLLSITNNQCEKILIEEKMETLLTFINTSKEEITIKDLKITLKSEEKKSKNWEKPLDVKLNENQIKISPKKSYSIPLNFKIKSAAKFKLQIFCHTLSSYYDNMYFKIKQRNLVKESTLNYFIKDNIVEFFEFQKFNFEVYNPFIIMEKFYNLYVNQCLISIKIKNITNSIITLLNLFLIPKGKNPNKIEMVKSFNEIKNSYNQNFDSEYITLQSKEELIVLFRIKDPDIFYEKNEFVLNIEWLKNFDFITKTFKHEFNNSLNTYNDYYKMLITEKPEDDIILNQNFKIIINIKNKNKEKKYYISLNQEPIQDNDKKSNDREIEIIDIIEKKMELNPKIISNNFILICKSDILGSVSLPKLRFTLYEGDKNIIHDIVYDSLLSFNCIPKE